MFSKYIIFVEAAEKLIEHYPDLVVDPSVDGTSAMIRRKQVTSLGLTKRPSFNPKFCLKYENDDVISFSFEANLSAIDGGTILDEEKITKLLDSMKKNSCYVLCPGLIMKKIYQPPAKRLKGYQSPLTDQRHEDCAMWHIPTNRKLKPDDCRYNMCTKCKTLHAYLERRENIQLSSDEKKSRTEVSSNYAISYLSPKSQSIRKNKISINRISLKKTVARLKQRLSMHLPDRQSNELTEIISVIQDKHIDDVKQILSDADSSGKGDILRALWEQDIKEHNEFSEDQERNSMWSIVLCLCS